MQLHAHNEEHTAFRSMSQKDVSPSIHVSVVMLSVRLIFFAPMTVKKIKITHET